MAWQGIAAHCPAAPTRLAALYSVAAPGFQAMWDDACAAVTVGMQAATGDYSIAVMGAEFIMILLLATVVCKTS